MRMPTAPSDSSDPSEPPTNPPKSILDSDRYASISLDDGAVVIYDREHPETWVQSDIALDIGA